MLNDLLSLSKVDIPNWAMWFSQNCIGDIYAHEMVPVLDENEEGFSCLDIEGKEECLVLGQDIKADCEFKVVKERR